MDYGNQSRAVGRKLEAEIEQAYPGELHRWRTQPAEVQMPSGENLQVCVVVAAWHIILSSAVEKQLKTVLVVAHDARIKALLCHILGLKPIISGTSARAMGQSASLIIPKDKMVCLCCKQ